MPLADSLLAAIVRADGDAMVMHVGERPYVMVGTNPLHISTHELTLETTLSMLAQLLPAEMMASLEELGAVEHRLPDVGADRFNCVAARGGDDIWIEIRRRRNKSDAAVAAAPPELAPAPAAPDPVPEAMVAAAAAVEEARRLAAEAAAVEERRIAAEAAAEEERRIAAEAAVAAAAAEEQRRAVEAAAADEQRRLAAEAAAVEEERRMAAEAAAEEQRRAVEVAAAEEQRRVAAEAAAVEEERRMAAEAAAAEQRRVADEAAAAAAAEEARRVAAEAAALAAAEEERRAAAEAAALAAAQEERRVADEQRRLAAAIAASAAAAAAADEERRRAAEAAEAAEHERRRAETEAAAAAAIEEPAQEPEPVGTQPVEPMEPLEPLEPVENVSPVVVPMTRTVRIEVPPRGGAARSTDVERLLRIAAARGASALFLTSESRPYMRVDGDIRQLDGEAVLSRSDVEAAIVEIAPEGKGEAAEWLREYPELGRIRCTTFSDHRGPGLLLRMIATRAATAEQLGLSREVQALATEPQGLVLVTGPRASGKSTLLSALVDLVNKQRAEFVITLERQIRLVHDNRAALVSQREIRGGADEALAAARSALREGPDVLVVDDLISPHMVPLILTAASEGLLVFVSIAAPSTADAVQRFVELAAPEMRGAVQGAMAESFRGAVAQVLLKKTGGGLVAAREVLLATAPVVRVISDGQLAQLPHVLESGRKHGMAAFAETLIDYVRAGSVDVREAFRKAPDRDRLLAGLRREKIDTSLVERLA